MASLLKAAQCIGLSGRVSVLGDIYGFRTKVRLRLSLRAQIRLLQGKHIHLNLIRTAVFDLARQEEIDYGLQVMRNIYATVNVGIGRIQRFAIPPGHEVIDGDDEAEDLWDEFSVPNTSIDVFLVSVITGDADGKSKVRGSCDKDSKGDSGCAIQVNDNAHDTGITIGQLIAHEVGHFLGLEHDVVDANLMCRKVPNGGRLSGGQGGVMVLHCSIDSGCTL